MPGRKPIHYDPTPLTFKYPDGMKETLIAIAYYRGDKGQHSKVVRDFLQAGIDRFLAQLGEKDRLRYERILGTVTTSETYRKLNKEG